MHAEHRPPGIGGRPLDGRSDEDALFSTCSCGLIPRILSQRICSILHSSDKITVTGLGLAGTMDRDAAVSAGRSRAQRAMAEDAEHG